MCCTTQDQMFVLFDKAEVHNNTVQPLVMDCYSILARW